MFKSSDRLTKIFFVFMLIYLGLSLCGAIILSIIKTFFRKRYKSIKNKFTKK
jgi:hypothetical protein